MSLEHDTRACCMDMRSRVLLIARRGCARSLRDRGLLQRHRMVPVVDAAPATDLHASATRWTVAGRRDLETMDVGTGRKEGGRREGWDTLLVVGRSLEVVETVVNNDIVTM